MHHIYHFTSTVHYRGSAISWQEFHIYDNNTMYLCDRLGYTISENCSTRCENSSSRDLIRSGSIESYRYNLTSSYCIRFPYLRRAWLSGSPECSSIPSDITSNHIERIPILISICESIIWDDMSTREECMCTDTYSPSLDTSISLDISSDDTDGILRRCRKHTSWTDTTYDDDGEEFHTCIFGKKWKK